MTEKEKFIKELEHRLKELEAVLPEENDGELFSEYEYEQYLGRIKELKFIIELIKGHDEIK